MRLEQREGEEIDRSKTISFQWNGKSFTGFEGDTIASALVAQGVRVFSRSMKYHRPRGLLTGDYWDPNLFVQVGSEPNVRAGHRLIQESMDVSPQNVWPSLDHDLKAINSKLSKVLTPGFYYKTFTGPLWPKFEKALANFSPGGKVDLEAPAAYFDKRFTHPDVVVAGGGMAGISAAIAAADAGAQVLLVEHEHRLGGSLRWGNASDLDLLAELRATAAGLPNLELLLDSTVTGRFDDNWISIVQRSHPRSKERLIKARAKVLVIGAGLIERPFVFEGNDLPGVMLSTAARRLVNLYGVKPGTKALVMSANYSGDAAAADLQAAGVEVELIDARTGAVVSQVKGGSSGVSSVKLRDGSTIEADLCVVAAGWTAPTALANMAGDRPSYDPAAARFFPTSLPGNVLVAGSLSGDGTPEQLIEQGVTTGRLAASRAAVVKFRFKLHTARVGWIDGAEPPWPIDSRPILGRHAHPDLFRSDTHGFVDFSEDVTSSDLIASAAEGYDSIELLKRYTAATMGPQQGKLETVNMVAVLAEARGETIADVGTTRWRPPYAPTTLGGLAGRMHEPTRTSAIQRWHEDNGAKPILAGQWIRPDHYGDPNTEVRHVRTGVGIIDVTPLGKIELHGPDVTKLLNLLYTNSWDNLAVGSVRYGIMCSDDGVVLDDGVTARLGSERYLMTTTSSGAARILNWIENWLQTEHPDWKVHVVPVTTGYTSINVAGQRSRQLLRSLVEGVDLRNEAFRFMQVRTGRVAGIGNCIIWRIGFTGELSYELHVPSGFGLHVWEALLETGEQWGVVPFGLEAQRIMRLEKGHFIVGQDTDALTSAHALGLDNLIHLNKQDFVGRHELARADYDGQRLVSMVSNNPNHVLPEASQIVRPGTPEILGRITSSRLSPTLDRAICLALVDNELAMPGAEVTVVSFGGERVKATVMENLCLYDPQGRLLRG